MTTATATATKSFVVGKTYSTRSACDHECIFRYRVIARTAKRVTLRKKMADGTLYGDKFIRGVSEGYRGGYEVIYPEGRYSMCPVLTAE